MLRESRYRIEVAAAIDSPAPAGTAAGWGA
jgi:hypothetical protein